jgi:hypothetical protein
MISTLGSSMLHFYLCRLEFIFTVLASSYVLSNWIISCCGTKMLLVPSLAMSHICSMFKHLQLYKS